VPGGRSWHHHPPTGVRPAAHGGCGGRRWPRWRPRRRCYPSARLRPGRWRPGRRPRCLRLLPWRARSAAAPLGLGPPCDAQARSPMVIAVKRDGDPQAGRQGALEMAEDLRPVRPHPQQLERAHMHEGAPRPQRHGEGARCCTAKGPAGPERQLCGGGGRLGHPRLPRPPLQAAPARPERSQVGQGVLQARHWGAWPHLPPVGSVIVVVVQDELLQPRPLPQRPRHGRRVPPQRRPVRPRGQAGDAQAARGLARGVPQRPAGLPGGPPLALAHVAEHLGQRPGRKQVYQGRACRCLGRSCTCWFWGSGGLGWGMDGSRQAGRKAGREAGRKAGRQEGRKAGRQEAGPAREGLLLPRKVLCTSGVKAVVGFNGGGGKPGKQALQARRECWVAASGQTGACSGGGGGGERGAGSRLGTLVRQRTHPGAGASGAGAAPAMPSDVAPPCWPAPALSAQRRHPALPCESKGCRASVRNGAVAKAMRASAKRRNEPHLEPQSPVRSGPSGRACSSRR
jgi:hypothetical protein